MILAAGQETSLDAYAWETLNRLPLADATLSLWSFVLQPSFLQGVYERHRGRRFEHVLTFPTFVDLSGDALLHHDGSGRQSFQRAHEQDRLPTSAEAVYSKLRRVPLSLSLGFFTEATQRLRHLLPRPLRGTTLPQCLDGLTVVVGDGKTLKRVAKRLLPARGVAGKVFGGKLLVAFLPALGLAVAVAADPDGEANDCRLVPQWLEQTRQAVAGPNGRHAMGLAGRSEPPAAAAGAADHPAPAGRRGGDPGHRPAGRRRLPGHRCAGRLPGTLGN